jgi:hypothetical protein
VRPSIQPIQGWPNLAKATARRAEAELATSAAPDLLYTFGMILAFFVFSFLLLSGAALVAREIAHAPHGEETERGFEITWCNNAPEVQDVSCVWVVSGAASC